MPETAYALAFDTANEVISIGLGRLNAAACAVEPVAAVEVAAHRASNTQLLVRVDALLREAGVERNQLACVCVGRGPGSFTGVRIAMATAKGAAQALGAALVGVSSLDVVAWHAWASGVRGRLAVVADAMRKEVYPVRYALDEAGAHRLEADRVVKAQVAAQELVDEASSGAAADALQLTGDGLAKYAELFAPAGTLLPEELWAPTGRGLLLALQDAWRTGAADPLDAQRHNPAFLLPVYTRLSDAEENERIRLAKNDPKNLATGVQDAAPRRDQRATMHDTAVLNARPDEHGITYKPLDAAHAEDVAAMESQVMGSDAWNAALVADELPRADRTWWAAYASGEGPDAGCAAGSDGASSARGNVLVGYAGGMVIDGQVQILKIGTDPAWRRRGIARQLISRVASDARDLGATTCSLEVRASNVGAQAFYESLGMHSIGKRPHYYSDREDAVIMEGPLQGVIGSSAVGGAADATAVRHVTEDDP
ncbi:MAG: tRNA (adenosine(37)-N6)-threonylcarbamoyltransferase complex dimerization subunit type 1 TsaB, partial [Coriobacteriia bacterium]|nr:tRNA (adenosine(37)-N6)-threonylcarbamoyltransferase complex dimerization subunit type 1 TsaB [Coriobacteriia bacterium]